ncbi:MAG: hypothetical protein WCG87_08295 [Bacteroidota bacterium]
MKYTSAFVGVILGGVTLILLSCSHTKKSTDTSISVKNTNRKGVCGLDNVDEKKVIWYAMDNPTADKVTGIILPSSFSTYVLDSEQLRAFYTNVNASIGKEEIVHTISIPMPKPINCQVFEVRPSGVMAPELQAKFPEIASLKGTAVSHGGVDCRLDYDGNKMRGQIIWDELVYYITPINVGNTVCYIVYAASDANEPRTQPVDQNKNSKKQLIPPKSRVTNINATQTNINPTQSNH